MNRLAPKSQVVWLALLSSGCLVAPETRPGVELALLASTEHNHRGMTESERGAVQGEAKIRVPSSIGGSFRFKAWGNLDPSDDTGEAWRPNGHGGEITEVDLSAAYGRAVGPIDSSVGVTSYVLPNGSEFLNRWRGTTSEVFATAGSDLFKGEFYGFYPLLSAHYDIDEVGGLYLQGAVFKGVPLTDELRLVLGVSLGYSEARHSWWTYGFKAAGFSDLQGTLSLEYRVTENTTLVAGVAASTILDDDIKSWMENRAIVRRISATEVRRGIDADTVWFTLGAHWKF